MSFTKSVLNLCARNAGKLKPYKKLKWNCAALCQANSHYKSHFSTSTGRPHATYSPLKEKASILEYQKKHNHLEIYFEDGVSGCAPFLWLRDNCQCPQCFDPNSLGRKFLLKNLKMNSEPVDLREQDGVLHIRWNDGHDSMYTKEWLYYRAFTPKGKRKYSTLFHLKKEMWGKEFKVPKYDYDAIWKDERTLFEWLVTMEKQGAALITNTPCFDDAGVDLLDRVEFAKQTHFGRRSPVYNRPTANNLAFTPIELSLHTDLPSYDYQPGLIFLQMVKQCEGRGGASIISDGFYAANIMKQKYPEEYKLLIKTDVSFWDKGAADIETEIKDFYKMNKGPTIRLNEFGEVSRISHNSQIRDTFFDLLPDEVDRFYRALKLFDDLLNQNCVKFKMDSGQMLALDNVRCLHGRDRFEVKSERHIETFYLDWDEARSRRRVLEEQLGIHLLE